MITKLRDRTRRLLATYPRTEPGDPHSSPEYDQYHPYDVDSNFNRFLMLTIVIETILSIITIASIQPRDKQNIVSNKSVPQVVCISDKMDREIQHFLMNASDNMQDEYCYWNLIRQSTDSRTLFSGIIYRPENYIPQYGKAYLQYGKNIIVVEGKIDRSFFRRSHGKNKKITMQKGNAPDYIHSPYLKIGVSKTSNGYLRSQCNYELSALIDSLPDFSQNSAMTLSSGKHGEDIDSTILIPRAKCKNAVLDKEIEHFFSQYSQDSEIRIWNLLIQKQPYTYCNSTVYKCTLHLEPFMPDPGVAYLDYGSNLVVIEENLDELFFMPSKGPQREITVWINRIPVMHSLPFMVFWMKESSLLKKYVSIH